MRDVIRDDAAHKDRGDILVGCRNWNHGMAEDVRHKKAILLRGEFVQESGSTGPQTINKRKQEWQKEDEAGKIKNQTETHRHQPLAARSTPISCLVFSIRSPANLIQTTDLFLTYQLMRVLYVETSWFPYQLFYRTFNDNLTAAIASCQSCVVYTTFVGNSVLSFITSELNYKPRKVSGPQIGIKATVFGLALWHSKWRGIWAAQ